MLVLINGPRIQFESWLESRYWNAAPHAQGQIQPSGICVWESGPSRDDGGTDQPGRQCCGTLPDPSWGHTATFRLFTPTPESFDQVKPVWGETFTFFYNNLLWISVLGRPCFFPGRLAQAVPRPQSPLRQPPLCPINPYTYFLPRSSLNKV